MSDNNLEVMFATSLSIASLGAALAMLVAFYRMPEPQPLLIYDGDMIALEAQAYMAAGQDPLAVIDAAVTEAVERGYIVVDARNNIKGPASTYMHLYDFIAVGGAIGREQDGGPVTVLPGTTAIQPEHMAPAPDHADAVSPAPLADDAEAFARQLYGGNLPVRGLGAAQ